MNFLSFFNKKILKNVFVRQPPSKKFVVFLAHPRRPGFQKWKRKLWKIFHRNTFKSIVIACTVFIVLVALVKQSIVIKAEMVKFYPNTCLGGWQHPENAEGEPNLSEDATAEEFSDKNSTVLGNVVSQIFCSDFTGEIPKDAEMKTLLLKLSWSQGLEAPSLGESATNTIVVYPSDEVSSSIQNIIDAPASSTLTISSEDVVLANGTTTDETQKIQDSATAPGTSPAEQNTETIPVSSEVTPSVPESGLPTEVPAESAPVSFLNQLFQYASAQGTTTDATTTETVINETKSSSSEFLEVLYTLDGTEWHSLGKVSKDDWTHEFKIPVTEWDDISKLQVSIQSLPSVDVLPKVYLDGMWLEAEYEKIKTLEDVDKIPPTSSGRKVIRSDRVFKMSQNDFSADANPSFEVYSSLQPDNEESGAATERTSDSGTTTATTTAWYHVWNFVQTALAQGTSAAPPLQVIKTELLDGNGRKSQIEPIVEEVNGSARVKIPRPERQFSPGKYILHAEFSDGDTLYVTDQEFEWGVLVINANKSVYLPGEAAYIQMAALNENGHTLCHEPLELSITDPAGSMKIFSTDDGGISFGDECGVDNVTNAPDYFLHYTASSTGTYLLTLSDKKTNHSIKSNFYVRIGDPFEVERIGATRINPWKSSSYKMELVVKMNQDWSGSITESVPAEFEVMPSVEKFQTDVTVDGETKYITWNAKNVKAGDTFTLSYIYKAPKISPEIHLLGPLQFSSGNFLAQLFDSQQVDFKEERQWQIASDAVNAKIRQEINILDKYLGATSGAYATSSEIIQIDTTQYTSPTYYFEVVASSSASVAFVVELESPAGATTSTIFVPTGSTSYTRFRSAAFTPTTGANNYIVRVGNASGGAKGVLAARVIILQGVATLTNTETQVEIGSATTSASNTTTLPLQSPKYWYYDSSKWDGSLVAYAEVTYQTGTQIASSTTYSTAGTFTYNESAAGVSYITVEAWGGGGGGGAAATNGGGGGGGGAYARSTTTPTGSSHTLVVAAAVNSEVTGNDSTYDTTVVVADGGAASTGNPVGAGGTTANSTGQVEFTGGTGGAQNNADTGGGGGGSAGPGGDGTIGGAATASVGGGGGNANGVAGQQANGGNGAVCLSGGNGGSGTSATTGGNGGGGSDTSCTAGGSGGAPGGGGGGIDTNTATTNSGARGQIKITETYGQTGIALEEDNGSFGGWTFKTQIIAKGAATSTSDRVRSSSFVPISGRNYRLVASTTNSGVPYYIYNAKIIVDQTSATLLEPQYLLANTKLSAGTGLQKFLTSWDSTEWNTANTYIYDVDSAASSGSIIGVATTTTFFVTGSTVSSPNNRGTSSPMTMPSANTLDTIATTNNGDVYASRILVQVDMTQFLTFSISDNSLSFGTLSSSVARYASSTASGDANDTADAHTLSVATNAAGGYVVTVSGSTLTSGNNTIATSSTAVASSPGTEQFGMRLIVNSGTGSAIAPYASANWSFDSATFPDQVASGNGDSVVSIFGVRYIANITADTEAGSYSATLTYIATATF